MRSGMTDSQIIYNWLSEFGMQQYYQNFVMAGYDLLTIFKMTPSDLGAIGCFDPIHRQLIKQNMARLNLNDLEETFGQLLLRVNTLNELLKLIHLEQYFKAFSEQKMLVHN
jgi:hypothetical protein